MGNSDGKIWYVKHLEGCQYIDLCLSRRKGERELVKLPPTFYNVFHKSLIGEHLEYVLMMTGLHGRSQRVSLSARYCRIFLSFMQCFVGLRIIGGGKGNGGQEE